ncbi:hypothetical protein AB6D11_00780 [Vibrio splendidus]
MSILQVEQLTFEQYVDRINPGHRRHANDSFKWSSHFGNKEDSVQWCRRFKRRGLVFHLWRSVCDQAQLEYVKTHPDTGLPLKDQQGRTVLFTEAENVKRLGDERFRTEYAVTNDKGLVVASAIDEYGTLLVRTDPDYQGMGLGRLVQAATRDEHPFLESGGLTDLGKQALWEYYSQRVRLAHQQGRYEQWVNSNEISESQYRAILLQSRDTKRGVHCVLEEMTTTPKGSLLVDVLPSVVHVQPRGCIRYRTMALDPNFNEEQSHPLLSLERLIESGVMFSASMDNQAPYLVKYWSSDKDTSMWVHALLIAEQVHEAGLSMPSTESDIVIRAVATHSLSCHRVPDPKQPGLYCVRLNITDEKKLSLMDQQRIWADQEQRLRKQCDPYDEAWNRIMEAFELGQQVFVDPWPVAVAHLTKHVRRREP